MQRDTHLLLNNLFEQFKRRTYFSSDLYVLLYPKGPLESARVPDFAVMSVLQLRSVGAAEYRALVLRNQKREQEALSISLLHKRRLLLEGFLNVISLEQEEFLAEKVTSSSDIKPVEVFRVVYFHAVHYLPAPTTLLPLPQRFSFPS